MLKLSLMRRYEKLASENIWLFFEDMKQLQNRQKKKKYPPEGKKEEEEEKASYDYN